MTITVEEVYPSIRELMPESLRTLIPSLLAEEISERYERLGPAYITVSTHKDGRFINGMMFTNRVDNCIEELVDAVFCILGWIFKHEVTDGNIPDSAFTALTGLISVYSLLVAERNDPLA